MIGYCPFKRIGKIYRGQRLVNWDPSLKTAVSDLEVESKEEDGFMWHIRYPLVDNNSVPTGQSIVVATTRPETLLGDSAIMVHPEDERYRSFVGQRVALPLCGRTIPVIADDYVEAAFGTGAVKVTPAHDPNDYAVGQRHKLPMHTIFTLDATVNDDVPEAYRGLDRFDARAQIVADLKAVGLLVDIKAPQYSAADRWIVSKLQTTAQDAAKNFAEYRLDNLTNTVYDFAWNEFCAWYLEVAKVQLQTGTQEQKTATRSTLIRTLDGVLRLVHPIMPFMTEELWQKVAPVAGTKDATLLGLAPYPELNSVLVNPAAEQTMAEFKALVEACRALRAEMKVPPSTKLPLYVLGAGPALTQMSPALIALAKLSGVSTFDTDAQWKNAARGAPTAVVGQATLCLHVDIDPATELARLDKERARLQAEIGKAQGKLNNAAFVAKAPESVLAQERDRLTEYSDKLTKIKMQLAALDLGMAASELLPGSPSVKRAEIAEIGSPPHM